ncbi:MAG: hypothetical protein ACXITV_06735 [Luteibaculaceae bacterium]
MLKYVFFFCSLCFASTLGAQADYQYEKVEYAQESDTEEFIQPTDADLEDLLLFNRQAFTPRTGFGLQLGTSFLTDFNGNNGSLSFIAPNYRFQKSERFFGEVGAIVYQGTGFFNTNSDLMLWPMAGGFGNGSGALLYGSGTYLISNKFAVTGTVFSDANFLSGPASGPLGPSNGVRGAAMDFHYKPSERTTISIGVSVQEGNAFTPFGMPAGNRPGAFQGGFGNPQPFAPGF